MSDAETNYTELAWTFSAEIELGDLDGVGGRPVPTKPISSQEILGHIAANANRLPQNVDFKLSGNTATIRVTEGGRYAEGTCETTSLGFDINLEYNFMVPRFMIWQVILEALSAARDEVFKGEAQQEEEARADYVRIEDAYANAKGYGFTLKWKLGPYSDKLKVKGSTGLTDKWYRVWDGGVDGIIKVKIYARIKGTNELCVKVKARGPFGWTESHTACVTI